MRAIFNLFVVNQDDHTKNWAFLDDDGGWRPSLAYDVTFSPRPYGEHGLAFLGHGAAPPLKAMQQLAGQENFATWARAREAVERVVAAVQRWPEVAAGLGVRAQTRRLVSERLREVRVANKALLGS